MITHVAFTAIPVRDLSRSRRFYEEALGLACTHEVENEWLEYDLGDTTLVLTTADDDHPAGNKGVTVALEVSDLGEFLAQLRQHSVSLARPPGESPICRSATVNDPDGHELIIHQRKSK